MKNIEVGYGRWRAAFGQETARRDYFDHLLRLEQTGAAVKSVIGYLLRKPLGAD